MFEEEYPPLIAVASPPARRFRPQAALSLGALLAAALSFVWIKGTASADRRNLPVEEMQAGTGGAAIGLAGIIGGAPFQAMMDRAGASEAQIVRIADLAQATRSDVDRLIAVNAGRSIVAADAARVRIDQAMAEIAAALTPAQRARLSSEAIAGPAAVGTQGGVSKFPDGGGCKG